MGRFFFTLVTNYCGFGIDHSLLWLSCALLKLSTHPIPWQFQPYCDNQRVSPKKCPNVALGHHFLALRRTSLQDFGIWLKITLKCDNLLVSNLWANERPSRLAVPSVQSSLVCSTHSDSKYLILWRITDIACSLHLPRGCKINRNCCGVLSVQMVL